jgi:type IV pilus assembly protein PilA
LARDPNRASKAPHQQCNDRQLADGDDWIRVCNTRCDTPLTPRRYSVYINEIGFSPERGNRYYYQLGAASPQDRSAAAIVTTSADDSIQVDTFKYSQFPKTQPYAKGSADPNGGAPGVWGTCANCNFIGTAAGDIDAETKGIDSWFISTLSVTTTPACPTTGDTTAPAGLPFNTYNDVTCDT